MPESGRLHPRTKDFQLSGRLGFRVENLWWGTDWKNPLTQPAPEYFEFCILRGLRNMLEKQCRGCNLAQQICLLAGLCPSPEGMPFPHSPERRPCPDTIQSGAC